MVVRKTVALALLLAALLAPGPASALDPTRTLKQFRHTAWTIQDGVPSGIFSIAQTPDGYLWLGSISGLFRFDGMHAEPFPSPGIGHVSALAVADTGDLWIGSNGVARLSRGVLTRIAATGLSNADVRIMAAGPGGQVWVANADGQVAGFNGRRWRVVPTDWGPSGPSFRHPGGVWALAVARDGVVWAKNLLALYYLRPGAPRFIKAEGYGGGLVNFARAPDGRLWTADFLSHRFYVLPDLGSGSPPPPRFGAVVPPGVLGWTLLDRDGALWCANSITNGLRRMRSITQGQGVAEAFTPRAGLSGETPDALIEDHEGDIWVGTDGGLDRFAPANVVTEPDIPFRPSRSRVTASGRALYVATGWSYHLIGAERRDQVYRILAGSAPKALPIDFGKIDTFSATPSGELLVGSGKLLRRVEGDKVSTVSLPVQADGNNLLSAASDGQELWVSLVGQGVFRRRANAWSKVELPDASNGSPYVRADRGGAFWLFYPEGLIRRIAGGKIDTYGRGNSPGLGVVFAFTPGDEGLLLGGLYGVSWFDGRAFHTLSSARFPFLASTLGIVADEIGGTWFSTPQGIVRVSTRELNQALRDPRRGLDHQLFDARDGFAAAPSIDQFGGIAVRAPDGRLAFLSVDRLLWIEPRRLYRDPIPPPVVILSLTADQRVFDPVRDLRLAPGTANLQIDYTALSLQNPDRVRFRYRLDGVDKAWIDAGGRRQSFYTRLGPGHYRFRVIAANRDGVWNTTGATIDFVIPPTFVQSGWFLLLSALAVILVLWAFYRLRMRQLATSIQSRLEERVAERERIARELHDTLLQGVQGLILRFQAIMEALPAGQPAKAQLDAALERADEVLISGRDRVRRLRALGTNDLAEALSAAVKLAPHASEAEVRISQEGRSRDLHPIVAEESTAIGREAILNALQHARATRIDVVVAYGRRGLTLNVSDDGVGIDADVIASGGRDGHFGLVGMRERAAKIRGKLSFANRPGGGTVASLNVPARAAFAAPALGPGPLRWLRQPFAGIG